MEGGGSQMEMAENRREKRGIRKNKNGRVRGKKKWRASNRIWL